MGEDAKCLGLALCDKKADRIQERQIEETSLSWVDSGVNNVANGLKESK